jgi:hypothetical protein
MLAAIFQIYLDVVMIVMQIRPPPKTGPFEYTEN